MKELLENVLERKLEISKTFKIKQDQRNQLKADIEEKLIQVFNEMGLECKEVDKALAIKFDNIESKTPNQYIPVKITVAIPSVDFDIDFENEFLIKERARKEQEKIDNAIKKAKKIERDKLERERARALKQATIDKG
mgnify:CR=1 FL=1